MLFLCLRIYVFPGIVNVTKQPAPPYLACHHFVGRAISPSQQVNMPASMSALIHTNMCKHATCADTHTHRHAHSINIHAQEREVDEDVPAKYMCTRCRGALCTSAYVPLFPEEGRCSSAHTNTHTHTKCQSPNTPH